MEENFGGHLRWIEMRGIEPRGIEMRGIDTQPGGIRENPVVCRGGTGSHGHSEPQP